MRLSLGPALGARVDRYGGERPTGLGPPERHPRGDDPKSAEVPETAHRV